MQAGRIWNEYQPSLANFISANKITSHLANWMHAKGIVAGAIRDDGIESGSGDPHSKASKLLIAIGAYIKEYSDSIHTVLEGLEQCEVPDRLISEMKEKLKQEKCQTLSDTSSQESIEKRRADWSPPGERFGYFIALVIVLIIMM